MISAGGRFDATYILPFRGPDEATTDELTGYLRWLGGIVDLIVVDGSEPAVADRRARRWAGLPLRLVTPDPEPVVLNGKVAGVLTGLRLARHDRVVIADDDVRYGPSNLERVIRLLDDAELVRPQNFFAPCPWHAAWDTSRSLLNRMAGGDYPGTLGVRRSAIPNGYDGDVLFENLELIRTVEAGGGRVVTPLDCYVRRLPPTAGRFWSQRRRQAYDDLAQPARLAGVLLVLPSTVVGSVRRRWLTMATAGTAAIVVAEAGRRRAGGRAVFPAWAPAFAPLWLLERGVCSWLALSDRIFSGGCRYHDVVIRRAASSPRQLRRALRQPVADTRLGDDQRRPVALQFGPEPLDVDPNVLRLRLVAGAPDPPEEMGVGEQRSGLAGQLGQQRELRRGEVHKLTPAHDAAGREVDQDVTDTHGRRRLGAGAGRHPGAAQRGTDPGQ